MARICIQGGQVVDPESGALARRAVYVEDGRIVEGLSGPADQTVDATGDYVAPGFVDLHTHVFSHNLFGHSRLEADRIGIQQGVACVVDAGSSGARTIDAFEEFVLRTQRTRVFAFINIGSPGLPNLGGGHASRPDLCDLDGTVRAFERHPEWLVGVKVLASQSHTGSFGLEAVKLARKAAELVNKPVMLHIGNAPPVIDDVLDLLRPGDIVTHAYHGKIGGVLGYRDQVIRPFREAVERGVVVDLGHGRSSFSFRVCEAAMEQGLPLHCISTDLHRGNLERYAVSLARTMSKVRMLGWSLPEVVRAVTLAPAQAIGIDRYGFGTLQVGAPAHVSIFREEQTPWQLEDAEGEVREMASRLTTVGVLLGDHYH
ncbi:MAG: amidohydrolase family protein, partial [Pseudomonadales bacterium]